MIRHPPSPPDAYKMGETDDKSCRKEPKEVRIPMDDILKHALFCQHSEDCSVIS
jgi:hypothetical protein